MAIDEQTAYLSTSKLNKLATINNWLPSSFIDHCKRKNIHVPYEIIEGQKRWRMVDLIEIAHSLGFGVTSLGKGQVEKDIKALREELAALRKERELIKQEIEDNKAILSRMKLEIHHFGCAMPTEQQVINQSGIFHTPVVSGIYFLVDDNDKIVYIGQSLNVLGRIWSHRSGSKIRFSRCAIWPTAANKAELDYKESLLIHRHQPKFNGNLANGEKSAPLSLAQLSGLLDDCLNKLIK